MAKLIANVFAAGEWWGPAHGRVGPPADVAEQITNPACWDEPPVADSVHDREAARALGHELRVGVGDAWSDDAPEHADRELGFIDDVPAVTDDEHAEVQAVDAELRQLAVVPDVKETLLAFAGDHHLEVNGRLGPVKLRAAIAKALTSP